MRILLVLTMLAACTVDRQAEMSVAAANALTSHYAKQNLRAHAAGNDCLVLLIDSETTLDDSTVEAIQYGTGDYAAYEGGVQQFSEDRGFRAVVIRDAEERLWTYGSITRDQALSITRCD